MTDQEAIKWINGRELELACLVDITNTDKGVKRINEEYNALLMARAALEKRIPMAPERIIVANDELWRKARYQCMVCAENLLIIEDIIRPKGGYERTTHGSRPPFCPTCGQALKWGKDAENSAIDSPSDNP